MFTSPLSAYRVLGNSKSLMGPRCSESAPSCARDRKSSLQKIPTYVDVDRGDRVGEAMPKGTRNRSDCALRFSRQSLGNNRLGLKPVVSSWCDTATERQILTTKSLNRTLHARPGGPVSRPFFVYRR